MSNELLGAFASAIMAGAIRVVDLSQTLSPSTPVISLPPPFAPSSPFTITAISRYDDQGPAWYWNNISLGEHTGTHLDAPVHWATGKDRADGFTDTIAVQRMVAPAVVIDCVAEASADACFMLRPEHIEAWEAEHGRVPAGAWVLLRTDWSKRTSPDAFLNLQADGPHTPGPTPETMRLLVEERDIIGLGSETVGIDHGLAAGFTPPFPAHAMLLGANKFGLASLTNLDKLPAVGAVVITPPLKIEKGSGSPLRVLALVGD